MERVKIRQVREVVSRNHWILPDHLGVFRRKGFNLTYGIKINILNRDVRILILAKNVHLFGMLLGLIVILVNAFFFRNKMLGTIFGLVVGLHNIAFLLDSVGKPPWWTNLMNRRMKHL